MQREGGLRATRARKKGAVCLHVMIGQGTFFLMLASMTTVVVGVHAGQHGPGSCQAHAGQHGTVPLMLMAMSMSGGPWDDEPI